MKKVPLKIIAGKYKQKTIYSTSDETRETAHLVRGAVFNMLYQITGTGLDLFAGSGAYGFEALSRGLDLVYLNDMDKVAYQGLNANKTLLNANAIITNMDYQKAIEYYQKSGIQFDYIFLDPPYHMSISPIITMVRPLLKADGTLICEIEKKSVYETDLTVIKERAHGIKKIILMKK